MEQHVRFVITPDGVKIAFAVYGSGPPLAYLNIPSLSHIANSMNDPVQREFYNGLASRRTLIRLDFRNSGMSDRGVQACSLEDDTTDLETVLSAAGVRELDIYATGGRASAAIRLALRPGFRVGRLILGQPISANPGEPGRPGIPGLTDLFETNWQLYVEMLAQRWSGRPLQEVGPLVRYINACVNQEDLIRGLHSSAYWEDWDLAPRVTCPVLVTSNESALATGPSTHARFAGLFPHGRFVLLPTGVEPPPAGDGGPVLRLVDEFLDSSEDVAPIDPIPQLTKREREVLALLAAGLTDRDIGERLSLSEHTVSRHLGLIYQKLSLHRRAEVAAYAVRRGLA